MKLAQTAALSTAASPSIRNSPMRNGQGRTSGQTDPEPFADESHPPDATSARLVGWRPKRLVRTALSSMARTKTFGEQMLREARRRRFHEAPARAYLGDGLPCNWSIWRKRFPSFTPILDFIHALTYLNRAAKAVQAVPSDAWDQYAT